MAKIHTIPQLFTRAKFCERCYRNKLPYSDSERLKYHSLRYAVCKTIRQEDVFLELRRQSKPGVLGYTPHHFLIVNTSKNSEGEDIFEVQVSCGIENCGCVFERDSDGDEECVFESAETLFMKIGRAHV